MSPTGSDAPPVGKKQRLLLRVERFSRERPRLVFALTLALVAVALALGSNVELESDILQLLPRNNPKVSAFRDALVDFGSIDYLLVLVDGSGDAVAVDDLEDFADAFADRLRDLDGFVEQVDYRLELDEGLLELLYDNALLFLPPERLPDLADRLSDDAIRQQIRDNKLVLLSPAASFAEEILKIDPLGLMPLFLDRLTQARGAFRLDVSDGYYLAADGDTLLMLVKPTVQSQDLEFDRRLLAAVRQAEADARAELEAESGEGLPVRVRLGGNYALALQESALIRHDVQRNLWVSLLAVSALYWLCYRRFAALLYSSLPLLVGQALTFGLAWIALRQLNMASSAFTALLMGLGTDFTIVMYARYVEERRAGHSLAVATERMVGQTGLGVFTGAITSAGTFFAMCISQFRGLFDLGFLIGSGILLCAVAIVFLLPAMISWNEGMRRRKVDAVARLHLQSFGVERLIPLAARWRKTALAVVVLATLAGGWLATELGFDDSINALRSNRTEASQVQAEVAGKFGASLSYMMAIAEAPDEAEAVRLAGAIENRLQPFVEDGTIGSYDSILTYLPPVEQQARILAELAADDAGRFDPGRIGATFRQALADNGFRQGAFDAYLARMQRFLTPQREIRLDDLSDRGLDRLVDRYVRRTDDRVTVVTYLFPTDPRWKRRPPPGLIDALTAGEPGIVVTGTNVLGEELRRFFSREAPRAVVVGLVLVAALLFVDFRSLRLTAVAMAQLLCGVVMMLGGMKLLDIELNYVNAFVATMILGVGIDYSIHLVHRMHETGGRVESGLLETGKAVVMASLTNIAGFGTLMLGSYPALRSFGLVATIGSLTCLFTSLTLVPALMARPADRGEPAR